MKVHLAWEFHYVRRVWTICVKCAFFEPLIDNSTVFKGHKRFIVDCESGVFCADLPESKMRTVLNAISPLWSASQKAIEQLKKFSKVSGNFPSRHWTFKVRKWVVARSARYLFFKTRKLIEHKRNVGVLRQLVFNSQSATVGSCCD